MWKRLSILLLASVALWAVGVSAQGPARPSSTTLRMRGTISKYDASTRTLTLSTSNGAVRFSLASAARIRQGWQAIDASDLEKLSGHRAVIRYSESSGTRTVESVHVFDRNQRMER